MKNFIKYGLIGLTALASMCGGAVNAATAVHFAQKVITGTVPANSTNVFIGSASEAITFISTTNVNSGDSVTIGAGLAGRTTYTFTTLTGSNIPLYGVAIGVDAATSSVNLLEAINNGPTGLHAGTNYGTNTPANTIVIATQTATNIVTITALSVYPGVKGNAIGVSSSQTAGDMLFPQGASGLYGGFDSIADILPSFQGGLGIEVYFHNTNSGSASNLTSLALSWSNNKTNLLTATGTNSSPYFAVAQNQMNADGRVFTNLPVGSVGGANAVAVVQTFNTSPSNNVTFKLTFSYPVEDGH